MWRRFFLALALLCTFSLISGAELTNDQIRELLMKQSLADYPGNCPCPYNVDAAGRKCGKRSAYLRPRGRAPLCYAHDVTENMIEEFRKRHIAARH